jgi:hypothetical protein
VSKVDGDVGWLQCGKCTHLMCPRCFTDREAKSKLVKSASTPLSDFDTFVQQAVPHSPHVLIPSLPPASTRLFDSTVVFGQPDEAKEMKSFKSADDAAQQDSEEQKKEAAFAEKRIAYLSPADFFEFVPRSSQRVALAVVERLESQFEYVVKRLMLVFGCLSANGVLILLGAESNRLMNALITRDDIQFRAFFVNGRPWNIERSD